ncbi:MAG: AAA family ATPase [Candidatus Micrarchaeia archaeon]
MNSKNKIKKNKKLIIAVTGIPATGKTTFAKKLSKEINIENLEINGFAKHHDVYIGKDSFGTKIVDIKKLSKLLNKYIKKNRKDLILVGHLAADLNIKYDVAIILRSNLKTLAKRMERRGYPIEKIRENLIAEANDYCSKIKKYAKETYEVETEAEIDKVVQYLKCLEKVSKYKKISCKKPEIKSSHYHFPELLDLINKGNKYKL